MGAAVVVRRRVLQRRHVSHAATGTDGSADTTQELSELLDVRAPPACPVRVWHQVLVCVRVTPHLHPLPRDR
jgi:hypothetical protein